MSTVRVQSWNAEKYRWDDGEVFESAEIRQHDHHHEKPCANLTLRVPVGTWDDGSPRFEAWDMEGAEVDCFAGPLHPHVTGFVVPGDLEAHPHYVKQRWWIVEP